MMHWQTWQAFWDMGGYALYVWSSFGVTVLLIALECWQVSSAWQKELALLRSTIELEQDLAQSCQSSDSNAEKALES
jgi:heme exporter protein CcmD